MTRKPLPPDMNIHAWNIADLMALLAEATDYDLRDLIELDAQTIYYLAKDASTPEDQALFDHLVVIGDEAAKELKQHLRDTVERLRPELRGIAHNVAVTSRSVAVGKLAGQLSVTAPLNTIEAALFELTQEPEVVLEDEDYVAYGRAMNAIISRHPHGRSDALD